MHLHNNKRIPEVNNNNTERKVQNTRVSRSVNYLLLMDGQEHRQYRSTRTRSPYQREL